MQHTILPANITIPISPANYKNPETMPNLLQQKNIDPSRPTNQIKLKIQRLKPDEQPICLLELAAIAPLKAAHIYPALQQRPSLTDLCQYITKHLHYNQTDPKLYQEATQALLDLAQIGRHPCYRQMPLNDQHQLQESKQK